MKKRSLCVLFSITAIGVLLFSGCTNQTTNNTNTPQTIHDEFSTNATGGEYELAGGLAHFSIPQDAVAQQITISMDSVADPPYDTNLTLTNCYTFGPDGTLFNAPVTLTLQYDTSKIPSNVPTDNLSLFVLSGTVWSKIQNCIVDPPQHTVTGPILHFSMIGVGLIPPEVLEKTKERNNSQKNNSAIITFEVPVQLYQYETNASYPYREWEKDYSYHCGGYIAWDPSPYVRYYELNIHYNGNSLHTQNLVGSCKYREWGKNWCPLYAYSWDETITKYIGGLPVPDETNFITTYDNENFIYGSDKHGVTVFNINDRFEYTEGLTRAQIDAVEKEMYEFAESYVAGWTFTVKNVS